jgi:hypothetical protein
MVAGPIGMYFLTVNSGGMSLFRPIVISLRLRLVLT